MNNTNFVPTFSAGIDLGNGIEFEGKGSSQEEAIANCLDQARRRISLYVEITKGVSVPGEVAEEAPKEMPSTSHALVVFVSTSHNDGQAYCWRFAAVPRGGSVTRQRVEPKVVQGDLKISVMDSNSEYHYDLPQGSLEFVNGKWEPSTRMDYGY